MRRLYLYAFSIALLLCIVVTALAIRSHNVARLSANDLVAMVSTTALSEWNPQTIVSNAHHSMLVDSDAEFYEVYFNALRRLGTLQDLGDANFSFDLPAFWKAWGGDSGTASYEMTAVFSNGEANITIKMIKENGRWWFTEYLVLTALMAA
jgi:hypothetical protein